MSLLIYPPLFVCLFMTPQRSTHTCHDNIFTFLSRRSSHFAWFTGALITLCLLALVNTMTTWQHINILNTVIISQSSENTQGNPHCWILVICPDRSHTSVSSAAQTWKKRATQKKRRGFFFFNLGSGSVFVWPCFRAHVLFNSMRANYSIFFNWCRRCQSKRRRH